ncbi:MAG TPA: hypothetical protein VJP79_06025 [Nitrososphaera sp.]|nr:hypothetical protein [Nitrososphaera sp.]
MAKDSSLKSNKNILKYAAIIGSIALLAVILSPVSPFAQRSTENPLSNSAGTIEEPPQPENISDEDVLDCTSLIQGVEYAIAGGRLQPIEDEEFPGADEESEEERPQQPEFNMTSEEKLASDTLLGEFCNRPELVRQISSAYDPAVNLVAYGCEIASGEAGDEAMQDSIADYQEIYCSSAVETVDFEIASWSDSMEIFVTDVIPTAREQVDTQDDSSNRTALLDEAESIVANSSSTLSNAQDLLDSGSIYAAAVELDKGITDFTALIERQDMVELLDI